MSNNRNNRLEFAESGYNNNPELMGNIYKEGYGTSFGGGDMGQEQNSTLLKDNCCVKPTMCNCKGLIPLGNIYRENSGGSFAGNVYSRYGLAPSINCYGGGNIPRVIENDLHKGK